jgi:hypothetical protein
MDANHQHANSNIAEDLVAYRPVTRQWATELITIRITAA